MGYGVELLYKISISQGTPPKPPPHKQPNLPNFLIKGLGVICLYGLHQGIPHKRSSH